MGELYLLKEFRLEQDRDENFEKFKQESIGTGIMMSFDQEKKASKKPQLSSQKKKKVNKAPVKKRSQWKKNNHSVLEPKTNVNAFDDGQVEILNSHQRKDSITKREEILESQRKMRMELRKKKKKNSVVEMVFVGQENEEYVPSFVEQKPPQTAPLVPQSAKVVSTIEKIQTEQNLPPKRVKKQWEKKEKVEVKPVEDLSQERKEWKRPAPIPKQNSEVEEDQKFEVVYVAQEIPDNPEPASSKIQNIPSSSEVVAQQMPTQAYNPEFQYTSKLDEEHQQLERMLIDMKMNLLEDLSENDNTTAISVSENSQNETEIGVPQPLPDVSQEEDREDFNLEETEISKIIEENKSNLDLPDPEMEKQMKNCTFGGEIAEVMKDSETLFVGEKIDEDLKTYNTFERIKDYLELEIGLEVLSKAHPILKEFGDDILYENNIPLVIEKLKGIVSEEEVVKYLHFFATLVFFENQQEILKKKKNEELKVEKVIEIKNEEKTEEPQPIKISNQKTKPDFNVQSFKDKPEEEEEVENIFKKYSNQSPDFDATANFGI